MLYGLCVFPMYVLSYINSLCFVLDDYFLSSILQDKCSIFISKAFLFSDKPVIVMHIETECVL